KWPEVSRIMYDEKIGILAIGESHLSDEIEADLACKRLKLFTTIDPDPARQNSAGVALVFNRDITNTEDIETWEIIPGRALLAKIPWHRKRVLTVLAIYVPADSMAANKNFWEELSQIWMTRVLPVPDMMLGDMNIVEEGVDR
ncbi:hypothetical protein C8R45DRAFT_805109, partial [Mycena sanguinolenta]